MAARGEVPSGRPPAPSIASPRLPPVIQHPRSRLGHPERLALRGFAPRGQRPAGGSPPSRSCSPPSAVLAPSRPRRSRSRSRSRRRAPPARPRPRPSSRCSVSAGRAWRAARKGPVCPRPPGLAELPREESTGQQADIGNSVVSRASFASSRTSLLSQPGTQLRIEADELEHILHEKMRFGGYFTLRQLFKNNDPEGKGQVNRDVLLMMLTKFLGRYISFKQYQQLLLRLKLQGKAIIKFEELYAAIRDPATSGAPAWLDPINHRQGDRIMMTASQVHAQLQEKAKQRSLDIADLMPQKNPGDDIRVLMPEFKNILNKLGFHIGSEEFEKLWRRYDTEGTGVLKGDILFKKLGAELQNGSSNNAKISGQSREISKAEWERRASLDIERWLKDKFREGFRNMKEEFEKHDPQKTGKVGKESFLSILQKFDMNLKKEHFNLFLARCGLENSQTGINYLDRLRNFQDRSDRGITHKILSNPKHNCILCRFHHEGSISPASTLTAIEAKLANLFQSDFLSLLATFQKIDRLEREVISQQEFQAAVESRFGVEITDEEFELLLDRIPLDEDGNVRYPQFMVMFDSRGLPSLFDEKSVTNSVCEPNEDKDGQKRKENIPNQKVKYTCRRTPMQLFKSLKSLLNKHYQAIEKEFEDLDEMNSRRLTQETMYLLLKRFDIRPEITRGEIHRLWETLITNQDNTLDFMEFVRHFGYSPSSSCFPNAKISPPRKGDNNFRLCSKKLSCDSDILVDRVRAKVEYLWDDLKKEFEELDPYHTGFVSKEEFKDILTELCVHLNEYECEMLGQKFESNGDGRVSYLEFLKPFALSRQRWMNGNNIAAVMQASQGEIDQSHMGTQTAELGGLTTRLRKKLRGDWKTLRRAFKKLDIYSNGYLSLPEFRSVLKLCNLLLDEDEVYHILSKFDPNLDGRIDYKSFLEDTCKKRQPRTAKTSTENPQ
ncbi:EF-hand calcium-binding domain-containing protein 6-like isoform X2 [Dermochelys coriacea]|uniref:EF-hand calcium-binding domain-containing protein 6-like isoform X2 n=1 Tax=Dermochelys coriacea TaxID=27794 RepID=UPI0018E85E3B|nr:EF-hand calcium-binding domain-containing protein 6-like isoform X2 [Dermochelys coriacea]